MVSSDVKINSDTKSKSGWLLVKSLLFMLTSKGVGEHTRPPAGARQSPYETTLELDPGDLYLDLHQTAHK